MNKLKKREEYIIGATVLIGIVALIVVIVMNVEPVTAEERYNQNHGTIIRIEKVLSYDYYETYYDFAYTVRLLDGTDFIVIRKIQKLQLYEVGDFVVRYGDEIRLVKAEN